MLQPIRQLYSSLFPIACLCCICALPKNVFAQCLEAGDGPRIGLVLSGGGARGTAHVGVLQILEELKIPIHCVAGTSLGSVVGGLYALGLTANQLASIVATVDWNRGFVDEFPRALLPLRRKDEEDEFQIKFELGVSDRTLNLPRGVIQGHGLHLLLKELIGGGSLVREFDALPIPFRAVATDIVNARPVALARGDLARSIQASMAIPGVYAPVEINGQLLVDGGVTQNLPVDIVRKMGAEIIIAVDIGTPLSKRDELRSVVAILDQLTNVLTDRNVVDQKRKLGLEDVYIQPELGSHSTMDFASTDAIVAIGKAAGEFHRKQLSHLSVADNVYADYKQQLANLPELPNKLLNTELVQTSKLLSDVLQKRLKVEDDDSNFDQMRLHESLNKLYSTGLYERVTYDYIFAEEGTGLRVVAEEKTWGPDLIRFGFSLEDDFGGNNNFNLSTGYIRKAINGFGGDLRAVGQIGENPRILLEYFQPLRPLSEYYSLLSYEHRQYSQAEFSGNNQTGEFRTRRNALAAYVGRQISHHSDLRIGAVAASGRIRRRVGDQSLMERDEFREGTLVFQYRYDTLNSIRFPSSGNRFGFLYESAQEDLKADGEYDALSIDALHALQAGRNRFVLSLAVQSAIKGTVPTQKQFSRGGLLNTSGLGQDVQVGQHVARFNAVWFRPLKNQKIEALDYPIYYGASIGFDGVFQRKSQIKADNFASAGNIFVAADTPAGSVFLGFGAAETQGFSALLSFGVSF